ncbi:hypothetical protein HHK36_009306 [Tetracentron sinense]|uniref:Amino acid transporter transmembrane domain-containing protein n=1 Tax=Tetracentron sinense TaxID=13715 RepID=A0A834ZIP4_TETSI|nr:hypothetical protein HHK36_009306 [Tetracentron sinense]
MTGATWKSVGRISSPESDCRPHRNQVERESGHGSHLAVECNCYHSDFDGELKSGVSGIDGGENHMKANSSFVHAVLNMIGMLIGTHVHVPRIHLSTSQLLTVIAVLVALPSLWLRDLSSISFLSSGGILMSLLIFTTVVSIASFTLVTIHYSALGFVGAKLYGPEVNSQITLSMPRHLIVTKIALWATVLTPMTKYALEFAPIAIPIEHNLPYSMGSRMRMFIRGSIGSLLLLGILGLALSVPYFQYVLGLTGSLVSISLSITFPCAFYTKMYWSQISKPLLNLNVTLIAFGSLFGVLGIISSPKSLIKSIGIELWGFMLLLCKKIKQTKLSKREIEAISNNARVRGTKWGSRGGDCGMKVRVDGVNEVGNELYTGALPPFQLAEIQDAVPKHFGSRSFGVNGKADLYKKFWKLGLSIVVAYNDAISCEDIDEDELLQIALKEQEQRDLNYRKSQPSKPVANFVQPPPPPRSAKDQSSSASKNPRSNPPPMQKSRRAVEDDDDSEVELLSISSGDEDSSKDRGYAAYASKSRRAPRGGGGGARDDAGDRGWDGDEPNCWKRVDEPEALFQIVGMGLRKRLFAVESKSFDPQGMEMNME